MMEDETAPARVLVVASRGGVPSLEALLQRCGAFEFLQVASLAEAMARDLESGGSVVLVVSHLDPPLRALLAPLKRADAAVAWPVVIAAPRSLGLALPTALDAGAHELHELEALTPEILARAIASARARWEHDRQRARVDAGVATPSSVLQQARQDMFRHIVELSPFAVVAVDADFRLAQVSAGAQKALENVRPLLGRDFAEVLRSLWPEPFASEAIARFRHTLETGEAFHSASTQERRRDIGAIEAYDWKVERVTFPDGRAGVVCHFSDLSEAQRHAAALRASERRFRSTFENAAVGIAHVQLDGRWLEVNERLCIITGYSRDELLATNFQALTHPEDVAADVGLAARVARGELDRYSLEKRYIRKDGREVWVNLTVSGLRSESGEVEHFISVVEDISARRRAEQAMQAALDASGTGTFRWELLTDELSWDEALDRLFGLEPGVVVRSLDQFLARVHPDDRPGVIQRCQRCKDEGADFEMEFRVTAPDGGVRWLFDRGRTFRGPDGRPAYMTGACVDITALKHAELALRARERELRTIADNSPVAIARFDRALRHLFVNVGAERAAGRSAEQLLGRTNRELGGDPGLLDAWDRALTSVFETGQPLEIEFEAGSGLDARRYASRLVPERSPSGEVETVLAVADEVTEARRYETELRASETRLRNQDRRKDEFLATLAHELRNPLAPLRTGLELLRRKPAGSPESTRVRDTMERQIDHLVRLVDDLLDVARVNRGDITLRRERVLLSDAVRDAVEVCRPVMDAKAHALTVQLAAERLVVDADRTRLVQALGNLLTNAAKYTDAGGHITLRVGCENGQATVAVSDNGVGIAAAELLAVWEMFAQVRSTLDRAQGGLGIGLWLVKRLVEMHGGVVSVESAGLGRGSTFSVRLPLVDEVEVALSRPAPRLRHAMKLRIMVVDDNEDAAELLAMLLGGYDHDVRTAHDGSEALATADTFQPEVVFLDIGMPGMDGYEVARRLRALAGTREARLVALTGWGGESDKAMARDAGFDDHLTKPVAPAVVDALIRRLTTPKPNAEASDPKRLRD